MQDEIISKCERSSLVKLIPCIEEKKFNENELIYSKGEDCENFYLLTNGKVKLKGSHVTVIDVDF